ncbi:MAG: TetR/AcrR family transcriptional regulator [Actinobacteria bacterium]|nr:TetR/AcrR family transcriptional regulator [Actinomycetota bacterium]
MGCLRWSQFDEYLNRSLSAQIAFLQVAPSAATLDDMGVGASSSGGRQDRRKAATRAKILAAAEELFDDRGYADTSIEDISESADVAVRTIYMHFPTKAAIMLAYFDRWVDAFSLEVQHRPVSEPVVESVREALLAMERAGWVDRVENEAVRIHPIAEHLDSGAPDIAGHILQRWMREMMVLVQDFRVRGDYPAGSLEPQARATAVFASWIAAMSVARQRALAEGGVTIEQVDSAGLTVLTHLVSGKL